MAIYFREYVASITPQGGMKIGYRFASSKLDSSYTLLTNREQQLKKYVPIIIMGDSDGLFRLDGDVSGLFRWTTNKSFNTSNWVFSDNVTNFNNMFADCPELESITLSNSNSNVKPVSTDYMFYNCPKLTTVNLTSFDYSRLSSSISMFENCSKLTSISMKVVRTSEAESADLLYVTNRMFYNCQSLTTAGISMFCNNSSGTKLGTTDSMFYGCSSLTTVDLRKFDCIQLTSSIGMFENCTNLTIPYMVIYRDERYAVGGRITFNAERMFYNCTSLTDEGATIFCNGFTAKRTLSMAQMFYGCQSLVTPTIKLSTQWVTDMHEMFRNCTSITHLDLSSFDVSGRVDDLYGTITDHHELWDQGQVWIGNQLNLAQIDTWDHTYALAAGVKYLYGMFRNCYSLRTLDISNFRPNRCEDYSNMFYGCPNLEWIDAGDTDWNDLGKGLEDQFLGRLSLPMYTVSTNMFYSCTSLVNYEPEKLDIKKANSHHRDTKSSYPYGRWEDLGGNFKYHYKLYYKKNQGVEGWGYTTFTNTDDGSGWTEFVPGTGPSSGSRVRISGEMLVLPENCTHLFYGAGDIYGIDRFNDRIDTSHVKDMSYMFADSSLEGLDTYKWNFRSVTDISYMFSGCTGLDSYFLDLTGLKSAKHLTKIEGLFSGCSSLTEINLTGMDTGDVKSLDYLFSGCTNLTTVHLESCNFSEVTSVTEIFRNCTKLELIFVNPGTDWEAEGKGTYGWTDNMFANDVSLRNWTGAQTLFNAHDHALDKDRPGYFGYFTAINPYYTDMQYQEQKRIYQKIDGTWQEIYTLVKNDGVWEYAYPLFNVPKKLY